MFSFLYNLSLVFLAAIMLPKLIWQWCRHRKYRNSFKARLGISLPVFTPQKGQEVIWMHAVSMGETRAIIPLFQKIRQAFPQAAIVISTTTETGLNEAKRSMPDANAHFFLPLDFSWSIRQILDQIQPNRLVLCESDFWYHLLKLSKDRGVRIQLVNGKVSERSCQRFSKLPFFTHKLFSNFDELCVQSERYRDRFIRMGVPLQKIFVTGNLKFDSPTKKMEPAEQKAFRESLSILDTDRTLVIGSTHAPEEDLILSSLTTVWNNFPQLKVLLVPRHPERFNEVAHLIQEKGIACRRFSEKKKGNEKLILIDAMGKLNQCYQIADVAIVGGSFTSHIGGHNILEPIAFDIPVFFGPHMHGQPDLEEIVLQSGAGKQIAIGQLSSALNEILKDAGLRDQYIKSCNKLAQSIQGATDRTFSRIFASHH